MEPDEVIYNTTVSYIWRCKKCGYEYPNIPRIQNVKTEHCPACLGEILVSGKNDLLTLHHELAEELSPNNEVTAEQILANKKTQKTIFGYARNAGESIIIH